MNAADKIAIIRATRAAAKALEERMAQEATAQASNSAERAERTEPKPMSIAEAKDSQPTVAQPITQSANAATAELAAAVSAGIQVHHTMHSDNNSNPNHNQPIAQSATMQPTAAQQLSVADKLAAIRARQALAAQQKTHIAESVEEQTTEPAAILEAATVDHKRKAVSLNPAQKQAVDYARSGQSFCLIGAAGTGKTTTVRKIVQESLERIDPTVVGHSHGEPVELESILLVAFTNRAVSNLRAACEGIDNERTKERALKRCMTIHKALHFMPTHYDIDSVDKNGRACVRRTMRFEPLYRYTNTLDHIRTIIIDEASMLGLKLFRQLKEACPNATFIFIGDLNQLRPVMDDSILGYKLGELPVVELTTVYRQAMESPIVAFQHNFTLCGKSVGDTTLERISKESNGILHFHPIKNSAEPEALARIFANAMIKHMDNGAYIPCRDIILTPNYINFGSMLIGRYIAQELGRRRQALVHEIRTTAHIKTGSSLRYYAVGDFVIHNKEEYFIASIDYNSQFKGHALQDPNISLARDGSLFGNAAAEAADLMDFATLYDSVTEEKASKEVCSHYLTLVPANNCATLEEAEAFFGEKEPVMLNTRSEVGELEFGYALTIHKSQGSEWRKVFLALHKSARNMLTREILYVGMTRAREELYVYYSPDTSVGAGNNTITKCIRNQEIKGNTWRDKLQSFDLKRSEYEQFMASCTEYGVIS